MTTNIIQLLGWKDNDIFDILISMSSGAIKTGIEELEHKYAAAVTKPFIVTDKMTGQDLHDFYEENSGKKKKPALIKSIETDGSLEYVMFNLWDYIKIINNDWKLNLKLTVLRRSFGILYMYHDYLITHSLYHPGNVDLQFPSELMEIMIKLDYLVVVNPKSTIFTLIDGIEDKQDEYYGLTTPPYSPEPSRYCDKCGSDC